MIKINHITGEITVEYIVGESQTTYILDKNSSIKFDGTALFEEATYSYNTYQIRGSIKGADEWMQSAVEINGSSSNIVVSKTGSLEGYVGATLKGSYETITNHGHIDGEHIGLLMTGYSTAENSGTIAGIYGVKAGSESIAVTNDVGGVITASAVAVRFWGLNTENHLTNYGTVTGGEHYAVLGHDGAEIIINRGLMEGDIVLGGGADIFDNRHGKVDHAISGGTGDDTLTVDDAKTRLTEAAGEGTDTVKSSASYKLSANVENLTLLGKHDINGTGNAEANVIVGTNGDNMLSGKGGADIFSGLRGDDILSGGSGADLFLFANKSGHDVITDFKHGEDHIDLADFDGIVGFDEMMAHNVSVSGNDLVIHSGKDTITLEHVSKADLDFHDFYY